MYTAIVVYHAPQMKNWRNIITDSLVRITASRCGYCELLREPDDDVRTLGQHDIRVLGLRRDARARGAPDDAADDRPVAVAADHATEDRTCRRPGTDLCRITTGDATAFVRRLDGVHHGPVDGVRVATYSDVRNGKRQGARGVGIGRRFDGGDATVDRRARGNDALASGVFHAFDEMRRKFASHLGGP